jgi:hypothetical protein
MAIYSQNLQRLSKEDRKVNLIGICRGKEANVSPMFHTVLCYIPRTCEDPFERKKETSRTNVFQILSNQEISDSYFCHHTKLVQLSFSRSK